MSILFAPITVGPLTLRNRFMRSATAEFLADPVTGAPAPKLREMYRALAEGGVGLIVTGHACVEYSGRTNDHMTAIASDALIPAWTQTIQPAQAAGAKVMIQINHGGSNVDQATTPDPISPSGVATTNTANPRAMTHDEILRVIESFGQAARRAREAGFDGVQIHGAHGYLVSQFLTPYTNQRDDEWGPSAEDGRHAFLRAVAASVRRQVGDDYPVWIKLGVAGKAYSGLTAELGAQAARVCTEIGIDCIEISHGLYIPEGLEAPREARYLPLAEAVRLEVGPDFPLALVSWIRSREVMEELVDSGVVDIISLCRPFIAEPNLVRRLEQGETDAVACVSCDQCRPREEGEGVACHNERVREKLA